VSEPRRCSEQDWFPFTYMTTAYLAVRSDGAVFWPGTTEERRDAVRLVMAGVAMLYAVWPGQRRSDVFVVDDPGEVAEPSSWATTVAPRLGSLRPAGSGRRWEHPRDGSA
jgi:hypothetical protein